jgi:hypothetical protein
MRRRALRWVRGGMFMSSLRVARFVAPLGMYMLYSLRGDVQAGAGCVSKSLVELSKSRGFLTVYAWE